MAGARQSPRRYSLRLALSAGIGGLLAALLTTSLVLEPLLYQKTNQRAAERKRYNRLIDRAQQHQIALLDQEVGLRGYLATGNPVFLEPYERGSRGEDALVREIESELSTADRGALTDAWTTVQRTSAIWHAKIAEPQKRARDAGPLPTLDAEMLEGKRHFDPIRTAHGG